MTEEERTIIAPGECVPFAEKAKEWPPIQGDRELVERVWKETDGLAYTFIWQCLLSF